MTAIQTTKIERRGLMLVLSSPSGAGKSTLARKLLQNEPELTMSVSVTTRARRGNEVNGTDYTFIDQRTFDHLREDNQLLEHASVHGNSYGTPREPVEAALRDGRDMLFDIDWQGTLQMFQSAKADIVSVFILPPSMAELRARLVRRAEDTAEVINKRLAGSLEELKQFGAYDYQLINDDIDLCFEQLQAILKAERLRRQRRMVGMNSFVDSLLTQGEAMIGETPAA